MRFTKENFIFLCSALDGEQAIKLSERVSGNFLKTLWALSWPTIFTRPNITHFSRPDFQKIILRKSK